jgi:Sigma-70, region 4
VPGRPEDDPFFRYLDGEMRERLTKAINDLPERERLIMTLYYYEETTIKEIGLILGVVESRVSQIHASAVLHLRARLANPRADRRTPANDARAQSAPRANVTAKSLNSAHDCPTRPVVTILGTKVPAQNADINVHRSSDR